MKRDRQSVNQRHAEMLSLIRQRQEILVEELCEIFNVSAMTVRRDLQLLEDQGKISRFHGGAAIDTQGPGDPERVEVAQYRGWIARYAASLIREGEHILINGSDTALAMLDYLQGRRVTVYTNNGHVVNRRYPAGVDLRLIGGNLRDGHILTGDMTLRSLMDIHVSKAFLGCTGISPDGEILCGIPSELGINETMITHADRYYILADHSKIGRSGTFASFLLERQGCIITDNLAPIVVTDRLRNRGMEVIRVSDQFFRGSTL